MRLTTGQEWRPRARKAADDEDGQVLLMVALLAAVFLALGYFAASVGVMIAGQVSTQRAADAAALAGCQDLPDSTAATKSALSYGASNQTYSGQSYGGKNAGSSANLEAGDGNQVIPNGYPQFANGVSSSGGTLTNAKITVKVQRSQPLLAPSFASQPISALAACGRQEGDLPVILTLDPTAASSLKFSGGFALNLGTPGTVSSGGVVVDSNSCTGLDVLGGSTITAGYVLVGCTVAFPNNYHCASGCPSTNPNPANGTVPDPFCNTNPPPTYGTNACNVLESALPNFPVASPVASATAEATGTGWNCSSTTAANANGCTVNGAASCTGPGAVTISPGVYWGGLNLHNPGTGTVCVNVNPGYYYLLGGSSSSGGGGGGPPALNVDKGVTVQCTGYASGACPSNADVLFYDGSDSAASKSGCGNIFISANAVLNLIPVQSGTFQSLLFFQSRNCGAGGTVQAGVSIGLPAVDSSHPCGGKVCGVWYAPGCPTGGQETGCTPPQTPTVTIGTSAAGAVKVSCLGQSGTVDDCINMALVADNAILQGQVAFGNPKIPSGSVKNGLIALTQ